MKKLQDPRLTVPGIPTSEWNSTGSTTVQWGSLRLALGLKSDGDHRDRGSPRMTYRGTQSLA